MTWAKRGLFEILASVLLFSLLAAVLAGSVFSALGNSQNIKSWFRESGIYDQLVTNGINDAQASNTSANDTTSVSLRDPLVQDTARQVFSPDYVQQNVETFIDSNYAWLDGSTKTPDFSIDVTQNKQLFAQSVGTKVEAYLNSLSVCTNEQLVQIQAAGAVNPLALACRPAQLDPKSQSQKVSQEIAVSSFIEQPVITAQTIGNNYGVGGDQPYYNVFSFAPTAYTVSKFAPIVFATIALLAAVGLFITAQTSRIAVRRIAFVLFVAGLLLVIIKVFADFIFNKVQSTVFANPNASELQQPITSILRNAEQSMVRVDMFAGIALLIIATALTIWLLATRKPAAPQHDSVQQPTQSREESAALKINPQREPIQHSVPQVGTPGAAQTQPKNAPRTRRRIIQ